MAELLQICGSLRQGLVNRMLMEEAGRLWPGKTAMGEIRMPLYNGDDEDAKGMPPAAQKLFDQIARAMGAHGERVADPAGIRSALRRALASGKPAVVP